MCFDFHAEGVRTLGQAPGSGRLRGSVPSQGGKATIAGTRFSVSFILACLAEGMSYEEAQEQLTTATTLYREMEMRFWPDKAEAELKALE